MGHYSTVVDKMAYMMKHHMLMGNILENLEYISIKDEDHLKGSVIFLQCTYQNFQVWSLEVHCQSLQAEVMLEVGEHCLEILMVGRVEKVEKVEKVPFQVTCQLYLIFCYFYLQNIKKML